MKDVKNIERVRKWQQEQKSKGLCIECSNTASGLRCDACNKRRAENRKKNYQEWKEKGLCCQCGKETLNNKNYCEKHYLMKISHARLGSIFVSASVVAPLYASPKSKFLLFSPPLSLPP